MAEKNDGWDETPEAGSTGPDPSNEPVGEADWETLPEQEIVKLTIKTHTGKFNPKAANFLIYGESGSGKTRLASTFPKPVFADIDHGMSSVTETVDSAYITRWTELEAFYDHLASGNHDYETVVIDTLNEMQTLAMQQTVGNFPGIKRSYGDLPSQSDYGKMLHDFSGLMRLFCMLPMKTVFLAQVTSRQFDTDVLMPQLVGKNSAREVARKMDVIGYTFKDEANGQPVMAIAFDAVDYVAKDRSAKLPPVLQEPNYAAIAAFWK